MRTMCHTRCRDEKAAVRKVALQLLKSVLELTSTAELAERGGAGTSAARTPAHGPSAEDLLVLEEATTDSLVRGTGF
jgi:condensin-2 complex subunit D3